MDFAYPTQPLKNAQDQVTLAFSVLECVEKDLKVSIAQQCLNMAMTNLAKVKHDLDYQAQEKANQRTKTLDLERHDTKISEATWPLLYILEVIGEFFLIDNFRPYFNFQPHLNIPAKKSKPNY